MPHHEGDRPRLEPLGIEEPIAERPETERRRDQPAVSFACICRGPKRQQANTRRFPRPDRGTVEPLENGDKETDPSGQRQPPKPPRPIPILLRRHKPLPLCRSEEHTSELQSLMRISYAVFCL